MNGGVRVELPGGRLVEGGRHRQAALRPLAGHDEEVLVDSRHRSAASRTTEVLNRCVVELGPRPIDADVVRSLSVGDREALLWHLRRITNGEHAEAVIECPSCDGKMEVELRVERLIQPPYDTWAEHYTEELYGHHVRFRLPTGADQERIAVLAGGDVTAAARELLLGCVEEVDGVQPGVLADLEDALAARFAELDPQSETLLDLTCPTCQKEFTASLDAAAFLFEEVASRSRYLHREVHVLAWYYHWSESEILAMTADRRRRYLDLIDESVGSRAGS